MLYAGFTGDAKSLTNMLQSIIRKPHASASCVVIGIGCNRIGCSAAITFAEGVPDGDDIHDRGAQDPARRHMRMMTLTIALEGHD